MFNKYCCDRWLINQGQADVEESYSACQRSIGYAVPGRRNIFVTDTGYSFRGERNGLRLRKDSMADRCARVIDGTIRRNVVIIICYPLQVDCQ
jgi:hypothetical protein